MLFCIHSFLPASHCLLFYLTQSHFSKFHKGTYNVFCSPLNSHQMSGLEAGPQDAIRLIMAGWPWNRLLIYLILSWCSWHLIQKIPLFFLIKNLERLNSWLLVSQLVICPGRTGSQSPVLLAARDTLKKGACMLLLFHGIFNHIRFLWWLSGQESTCSAKAAGDVGSFHESERFPRGGHGNPL